MTYNAIFSLAILPFDLLLLFHLKFNHRSAEAYQRRMRFALGLLLASGLADVVCHLISFTANEGTEGTTAPAYLMSFAHLLAFAFVLWYLLSYLRYWASMRKDETEGAVLTSLQILLFLLFLPVCALLLYLRFSVLPQLITMTFWFSIWTYAFYFVTEFPLFDRLKQRLNELSVAVQNAQEAERNAEKEDTEKNEFLSNMSHEIRTPLNAILGMDEMILRECRNKVINGYACDIRDACNSLLAIVNDILDFSKIESGSLETQHVPYHLGYVLETVRSMMKLRASDKGLTLRDEIDNSLPNLLKGDGQRISQVLINLTNNAIKYTRHGTVTMKVSAEERTADRLLLRFDVIDTGIGIHEEDLPKLFAPYERLDDEENRGIEGTGLGLTITHNLVRLMDGDISVSSEYGRGSTFTVRIPQEVLGTQTVAEYVREEESGREEGMVRFFAPEADILIVDDTPSNIRVVEQLLKQTSVRTDSCSGGRECLAKLKTSSYDVILLDHMMPDLDGIETLHRIRAGWNFDPHKTKIIVLTANAIAGARERYLAEGFDDYLSKPVEPARLEITLMRYLPPEKVIAASDPRYPDLLAAAQEKRAAEELAASDAEQADLEVLRRVQHVDLKEALRLCTNAALLRSTMTDFLDSIEEESGQIEALMQAGDWKNYTIKVHALKSIARLIGATALSEDARYLEGAGNAENEAEILAKTPQLLSDYRAYTEYLAPVRASGEGEDDTRELIDADELREAYASLREFVEAHDFDSADYIMKSLADYRIPEDGQAYYDKIRRAVRKMDEAALLELLS